MSIDEISYVSQISKNLVLEYVSLIDEINNEQQSILNENGELPF